MSSDDNHATKTWLTVFSFFMVEYVIPYDTRLASLVKKRDFLKKGEFFKLFFDALNNPEIVQKKTQERYLEEILFLTIPIYHEYYNCLTKTFYTILVNKNYDFTINQQFIDQVNKTQNVSEKAKTYITLIQQVEKDLEINISNLKKHLNYNTRLVANIYNIETKNLTSIIESFTIAYKLLNDVYTNYYSTLNPNEKQFTTKDYLILVINNELWNFLSHLTHAYTSHELTPRDFISDFDKAISHLRRAILDIYDGILMEFYFDKITPEYLNIRHEKLASLGSFRKMTSLTKSLKEYCQKIISSS